MYSVVMVMAMGTMPVDPAGLFFNRGAVIERRLATRQARANGCDGSAAGLGTYSAQCSGGAGGMTVTTTTFYGPTSFQSQGCAGGFAAPMQSQSCSGGAGGQAFSQGPIFLSQGPPPRRFLGFRQCGPNQVCAFYE